jgi:hypothetical protein
LIAVDWEDSVLAYEKLLTVQAVAVVAADESFLSLKRLYVVEAVGETFLFALHF